jgi:hypothetical protein
MVGLTNRGFRFFGFCSVLHYLFHGLDTTFLGAHFGGLSVCSSLYAIKEEAAYFETASF